MQLRHSHGWHARLCVASFAPRVILRSVTAGDWLPILPDCNRKFPAVVPLWKVMVGPRADELQPDPQGSGFSLGQQGLSRTMSGTRPSCDHARDRPCWPKEK